MKRPRLRVTLSLRVLLALILALGLGLGWLANSARRQRLAVAEVRKYNGYVLYDYEFVDGKDLSTAKSWVPQWVRKNLGDDYFHRVTCVRYINQPPSDATLAPLESLDGIEVLGWLPRMHHSSMEYVKPPPGLEKVTESGLRRLEGLTRLRRLTIAGDGWQEVPGFSLQHLRRSPLMEEISLDRDRAFRRSDASIANHASPEDPHVMAGEQNRRSLAWSRCGGPTPWRS